MIFQKKPLVWALSSLVLVQACSEFSTDKKAAITESEKVTAQQSLQRPAEEDRATKEYDLSSEQSLQFIEKGRQLKGKTPQRKESSPLRKEESRERLVSKDRYANKKADRDDMAVSRIDKVSVGKLEPTIPMTSPAPMQVLAESFADQGSHSIVELKAKGFSGANIVNHLAQIRPASESVDRENYSDIQDNAVHLVKEEPVSTFSIDVDTASYANVRRFLNSGRLPATDAVRVEELINYFDYDYPIPKSEGTPFSINTELTANPWNENTQLLRVGIQGYEQDASTMPASNLVFLLDVSGSMQSQNKLPLLQKSLKLLTDQLRAEDKISIVVYAGASGIVLEPTSGLDKATIKNALDRLSAGGSTNGAAGIRLAYQMAKQAFVPNGINRVIIATDGDFNVGTVNHEALKDLVEKQRQSDIYLSVLGFGSGNYNDHLMEELSNIGNGNAAYIDSFKEARKVLVDELTSTLQTIANDVKIQIEFNPTQVSEYRLIGYENRLLNRDDFNNDKIDAGEVGAGHTVTALYEITAATSLTKRLDPLRYQPSDNHVLTNSHVTTNKLNEGRLYGDIEMAFLKVRYKKPGEKVSKLIERPILANEIQHEFHKSSVDMRFAAAVAGFGQLLRGGKYTETLTYKDIHEIAVQARGTDPFGYRGEFIQLVLNAQALTRPLISGHKTELSHNER